jgi:hypothetical protein
MEDKHEWKAAKEKTPEKDPMGQLPGQPHVEYFSTELYGGGPQHSHLPTQGVSHVYFDNRLHFVTLSPIHRAPPAFSGKLLCRDHYALWNPIAWFNPSEFL